MLKKGYNFHFWTNVLGWNFVLTPYSMILRGVSFFILNFEYLGENLTKFENILTHWSVAQTSSNDEKKLGVENLVGLSLYAKNFHNTNNL